LTDGTVTAAKLAEDVDAKFDAKQDALSDDQLANIAAVPNKANRAEPNHAGNLAALDANGNPTNSGIPSANLEFVDNKQIMRVGMSTKIADGKTRQLALGDYSETNADGAIAIGVRKYNGSTPTKATADSSIAIGQGAQATASGATQIGFSSTANNTSNSLRFMDTTVVDGNGKIPS